MYTIVRDFPHFRKSQLFPANFVSHKGKNFKERQQKSERVSVAKHEFNIQKRTLGIVSEFNFIISLVMKYNKDGRVWHNKRLRQPTKLRKYKSMLRPLSPYSVETRCDLIKAKQQTEVSEIKVLRGITR